MWVVHSVHNLIVYFPPLIRDTNYDLYSKPKYDVYFIPNGIILHGIKVLFLMGYNSGSYVTYLLCQVKPDYYDINNNLPIIYPYSKSNNVSSYRLTKGG